MQYIPSISQIATLLADPKRSAMIWALIDGTARATEELARMAGLSPSSAGAHLARLSSGGLLKRESRGRKRFFRLAAPEVGIAVEALASVCAVQPLMVAEVNEPTSVALSLSSRRARTCQDHLGGELAAELYERLLRSRWIECTDGILSITGKGTEQLARSSIFTDALVQRQRRSLCQCADWSDTRPHLGGALGASLLALFLQSGWLRTVEKSHVLRVSPAGLREIGKLGR